MQLWENQPDFSNTAEQKTPALLQGTEYLITVISISLSRKISAGNREHAA